MMFRPTCTKETRTNNDIKQHNIKQHDINYSKQYMDKYGHELNQMGDNMPGWNINMNVNQMGDSMPGLNMNMNRQPAGDNTIGYSRLNEDSFLRTMSSSIHTPIKSSYENYQMDRYSNNINNQFEPYSRDNTPLNTRNIGKMKVNEKPIQQCFQQDYFMSNFETLNQMNRGVPMNSEFNNHFLDRNPVNTRRDQEEKTRLNDTRMFKNQQGGMMNSYVDLNPQYSRREKNNIDTSIYVPMSRTLALPRENV